MSPRTPEQFQEIREEKKALIMDVALQQFANEGYFRTTTSHIARHAGISKGLMYNYFASKEELLNAIISKSIDEISAYFDPDRNGYLSGEEFELFIRKLFTILREKRDFWRLFSQLMLQEDVRGQFIKPAAGKESALQGDENKGGITFLMLVSRLIREYFLRKKSRKPSDYDPVLDMNLFIYTVEGFARISVNQDEIDEELYTKTVNKIIDLYK